jgi:hypothetical protein
VQIFGSGFLAAQTVLIGPYNGVMASVPFTIENDGQIDFVMPEGVAGQAVSVTVQTAADAFTYVEPVVFEVDGAAGGEFVTPDVLTITVPAQGVSGSFYLTMTPLPPEPGVPGNYSFRLDALLNGTPLASLTNPVTIQPPIDEGIFAIQDGERPWGRRTTVDGGQRSAVGGRRSLDPRSRPDV